MTSSSLPRQYLIMGEELITVLRGEPLVFSRRSRTAFWNSLALHAGLLGVLLYRPIPGFVAPSSVRAGIHGATVTHLYWAHGPAGVELFPPAATKSPVLFKQLSKKKPADSREASLPGPSRQASQEPLSGPSAGSPYGSLSDGSTSGPEIRPALPVVTAEPEVASSDLTPGMDGNVVIEITIDELGKVVNEVVIASLGAAVDTKVLAALEHWRFRPATRDGVPVASKQDVIYHFKAG